MATGRWFPARRMTQAELESYLDTAANILRGSADHSEFRGYVFALLFYKRLNDCFEEDKRKHSENLREAGMADEQAADLAADTSLHHFVVPPEAEWGKVARSPKGELGQALNDAMLAIERANSHRRNNFDGILTGKIDFNKQDELPRDKLVNLINHFSSQRFDRAHVSDDLFGNAYEYLLRNFASKAGKSSGEFYTPAEVGFLMSEMIEPAAGMSVCDWACGSGGLLLQCIRYVRKHGGDIRQLRLYGQEANVATHNISRINMILHGIPEWEGRQGDSLREPRHLDGARRLKTFDRVIMNPPFSLEDWGYDGVAGGDKFGRFPFGLPPSSNGDWAWLLHIVASLKEAGADGTGAGKAIVVMSQGVLFRGQPEQTEEEDGQKQKADAEYLIRRGFVEHDLIEGIVVLPSKLFYGNGVPACLLLLNRRKPAERCGKILMVWASRNCQKANPQNLLRPGDLMRVLVPWRAFGDLTKARTLVDEHEVALVREVEERREALLGDIEDAFGPLLQPLPNLVAESATLDAGDWKTWEALPTTGHPHFGRLLQLRERVAELEANAAKAKPKDRAFYQKEIPLRKAELREETAKAKRAYADRVKEVRRLVKDLEKLKEERDAREAEVRAAAGRDLVHVRETATDLRRVCATPEEARRHFAVVDRAEIEENEFNLNLPRYVDTFEPAEDIPLHTALSGLCAAEQQAAEARMRLHQLIEAVGHVG